MAAKTKQKVASQPEQAPLAAISGFVTGGQDDRVQRLLNDRVRLGVLSSLAVSKTLTFTELKQLLGVTDGNLSVHARKLEDAGFVACDKQFDGRVPKTTYTITATGRKELKRFLKHMEALINATT